AFSAPIISFSDKAKQVIVGATVVGDDGKTAGMVGAALEWNQIVAQLDQAKARLTERTKADTQILLLSSKGEYLYHWDPARNLRIKTDTQGRPVLDQRGQVVTETDSIHAEGDPLLKQAGAEAVAGK